VSHPVINTALPFATTFKVKNIQFITFTKKKKKVAISLVK
jgi:hypothetical protein